MTRVGKKKLKKKLKKNCFQILTFFHILYIVAKNVQSGSRGWGGGLNFDVSDARFPKSVCGRLFVYLCPAKDTKTKKNRFGKFVHFFIKGVKLYIF